jgi:hypothetical protein
MIILQQLLLLPLLQLQQQHLQLKVETTTILTFTLLNGLFCRVGFVVVMQD